VKRPVLLAVIAIALLAAVALAWASLQAPRAPELVRAIPWSNGGVWLKADLHTHTKFSDGNQTVEQLVAEATKNGCDVVAITDHTDNELKAATPEYVDAIRMARANTPAVTVITGVEWNVPPGKGAEHAGVLFPTDMEDLQTLATFKDRFDDWNKTGENPQLALDALAWLTPKDTSHLAPVVLINHPSRDTKSTSAPQITLEALQRAGTAVLVGFEGAPGHQRVTPPGAFKNGVATVDRWDPLAADVGGAWDQWLDKGLDVWGALANSDFHGAQEDFWPCEFAATWIYAPDRTVDGILRALHAGSFFAEHGHIVTRVELEAQVDRLKETVTPGETVRVPAGTRVTVSLGLTVPERDYLGRANHIDTVELIGIADGHAQLLFSGAPAGAPAFTVPVTVPRNGIVLRARGGRTGDDGSALLFYTNPIRIVTFGQ
jgi:hypothetical protein